MMARLKAIILIGWGRSLFVCCLALRVSTGDSLSVQISLMLFGFTVARQHNAYVESLSLILHDTLCDLFVLP